MADIESNINLNIDTSDALASLRSLQRQISTFQQTMSKTGAVSSAQLGNLQQNLINGINSTGQFSATMQRVTTTTESFTNSLEKNKFSMGQYFKYAGAATKTFGKMFSGEFDTIEKVARERVKTLQTQYIKLGRDASGAMQAIQVRPQVLDMKDLGTQTAIANQKAQLFNQLMKQGSTELLNFGKNTQWAGRQLMVGFTIPLGIMGAAAAKEFKAIEEQVIRLERVYGDFTTTMSDTKAITADIKDLAGEFTKYGVAVSKTIGLAADAAAMGKTGADLVAQVAEANRLAVLGGVDQQKSLETTISLTNSFGIASDQLAGKINFLNAVENQTVTSIDDLTEAIPKAGPVVQQLGGNVEDLTFFLTAMKEGGINASEGANALKSGLASLINPTEEASTMLNGFGINLQEIVDANKGNVKGIVVDFAKALDTLDPLNRAQAIEQLFGKFQFSRLSTLFQNVIAEGSQASRVLDLTKSSSEQLAALSQRELARIEESPLYKFEGAIESFKAAMAPIGETFMKAVTPIINFGTDLLNKFNEMSDGGKQFVVILTGAVAGLGPILLMTFGLIANGVANLIKGFMFVRSIFTGTGKSSQLLTDQLSYMTSEQLQASAVAASLGQVHTNLIQTFNAEAGAVRNLAAAYGSGIAAQNAFMGPIVSGGKSRKPKKMKSGGVVMVPGTGKGDKVPAMLEPGEAVIPGKMAQRYAGLINGMIAGSIPGYSSGLKTQASHTQAALDVNNSDVIDMVDQTLMPGFRNLSDEVRQLFIVLGDLTASLPDWYNQDVRVGQQGVAPDTHDAVWESLPGKYDSSVGQSFDAMDDNWASLSDPITRNALDGIDSAIGIAAGNLARERGVNVDDDIIAEAAEKVLKDTMQRGLDKGATEAEKRAGQVAGVMQKRAETPGTVRFKRPEGETRTEKQVLNDLVSQGKAKVVAGEKGFKVVAVGRDGKPLSGVPLGSVEAPSSTDPGEKARRYAELRNRISNNERIDLENIEGLRVRGRSLSPKPGHYEVADRRSKAAGYPGLTDLSEGGIATREGAAVVVQARKAAGVIVDKAVDEFGQELVDQAEVNSPSKKTVKATNGMVEGVVSAIVQGRDDVVAAQRQTTEAQAAATKNTNPAFGKVAGGVTPPSVISPARVRHFNDVAPRIIGKVPTLEEAQIASRGGTNILKGKELQFARGAKLLDSAQMLKPMTAINSAMKVTGTAVKTAAIQVKDFGVRTGVAAKEIALKIPGALKSLATSVQQTTTSIAASAKQMLVSTGAKLKASMSGGKLGMMGAAASTGLFMASGTEGPVGDIASKVAGPMMALSMLTPVLESLPPQAKVAALAIAAVGTALVAGFIAVNEQIEKNKQAQRDQQAAMSSGTSTMESFAQAAGTINPSTIANQSRTEVQRTGNTEQTFGETYLASETGAAMASGVEAFVKGNSIEEAGSKISAQLSTAVSSGIMSQQQADSVAMALGDKLKNKSLTANIIGKMDKLLGPHGELIGKDPIQVAIEISKQSQTNAIKTMQGIKKDIESYEQGDASSGDTKTKEQQLGEVVALKAPTLVAEFNSMQQSNQLLIDARDQANAAAVNQLMNEGKIAEAQKLQNDYLIQRKLLTDQAAKATQGFLSQLEGVNQTGRDALVNESEAAAKKTYAGTSQEGVANKAIETLSNGKASAEAKLVLNANLQSGSMTPTQLNNVLSMFDQSTPEGAKQVNLLAEINTKMGAGVSSQVANLLPMFGDDKDAAKNFMATFKTSTPEDFKSSVQMFTDLQTVNPELNLSVYFNGSEEANAKLKVLMDAKKKMDALVAKGPTTMETVISQVFQADPAAAAALKGNAEWFAQLPAQMQSAYIQYFITARDEVTGDEIDTYLKNHNLDSVSAGSADAADRIMQQRRVDAKNALAAQRAKEMAETYQAAFGSLGGSTGNAGTVPQNTPSGSGGGGADTTPEPEKPPASFLDDIVKQLRKVNVGAAGITENFAESWATINGFFGNGASVNVFSGLEQQMRKLGAGEDLINLITGMSKEEWEAEKNNLFNFDVYGNITGFKDMASSIGRALASIKLGEFQSKQEQSIKTTIDQANAISKVVAAGASYAQAYELVQESAVAAAIAQETNIEKIKEIIRISQQAASALSLMSAAQSVVQGNQEATDMRGTISFLQNYSEALSDAQTDAILKSKELQTMLKNFDTLTIDQLKSLDEALKNADLQAEIELKTKMLTPEGMQQVFQDGFGKAMDAFSTQEQEIKLKFKLLKNPFEDAIKGFQDKIEDIKSTPGGLDDLEADLQRIGEKEIDINKKYEDRFKALDSIQKANDKIAAQQRTQLSLADALSQGDIGAAARAAQEIRSAEAAQALVDQREALKKSQELEIAQLQGEMGMSREQLEASIRNIKTQIFEIEEKSIEPAQYQLELLKRREESELAALTVLGKTKDEWDQIKNNTDLARVASAGYVEDMKRTLGVTDQLIAKWAEITAPKETLHTIIEKKVSSIEEADRLRREQEARDAAARAAQQAQASVATPPAPRFQEHTVVRGDTLWAIASRYLGAGNRYMEIFNNSNFRSGNPNLIYPGEVARIPMATGGLVPNVTGKFAIGTDTVPTMLTPGEFVVKKYAVENFGVDNLKAINDGTYKSGSVYNNTYSINVNARTNANADDIARTVIAQIKQVDAQRIRGNRF